MPTVDWLKKEFHYGYTSGDILAPRSDERRASEERECGGSYHYYFRKTVQPLLRTDARVLELCLGRVIVGRKWPSWWKTRAESD